MTKPTARPVRDTAEAIQEAAARIGMAADAATLVLVSIEQILKRIEALFAAKQPMMHGKPVSVPLEEYD